jgi:CheY-like chemotaxis protein
LGGQITARSTLHQGTTFHFFIQIELADEKDVVNQTPLQQVVALAPSQPTYRILIVEDKPENRLVLQKLLEPLGFAVRTAVDGREGVDVWESWMPHLIFMDMRMPVMDGYEATRYIKQNQTGRPPTIIVALTASAYDEERTLVLEAGCDDFIRKPYREEEIFNVLALHLGVQFVYSPTQTPAALPPAETITPETITQLPAEWRTAFLQAAVMADQQKMLKLVQEIAPQYPAPAAHLSQLIQNFATGEILELLQN